MSMCRHAPPAWVTALALANGLILGAFASDGYYAATRAAIDMECTMTLDDSSAFILLLPGGEERRTLKMTRQAIFTTYGTRVGHELKKTAICEATDTGAGDSDVAFFLQATTVAFLSDTGAWEGLVNKYCYARQHRLGLFLWIGKLREAFPDRAPGAAPCGDQTRPGNHNYKPIGARAILEGKRHISWLVMMDMDTFFTVQHFETNHWSKFLSTKADLVTGAPSYRTFLNGALLAIRNSSATLELLSRWILNRCGIKNQLSLWNSLFQMWRGVLPDFKWDQELMARYDTAIGHVQAVVSETFKSAAMSRYFSTSFLSDVQHFPFVDLHPNIGPDLMFRCNKQPTALVNSSPMICHSKCTRIKQPCGCGQRSALCKLRVQCR
mmetsp:Transcript_78798/g.219040  ORF Transcript_78798/g.219040 Transcript_78798/m.219040 type:complete len:381 (-) Transcript_78798:104-1246(-)